MMTIDINWWYRDFLREIQRCLAQSTEEWAEEMRAYMNTEKGRDGIEADLTAFGESLGIIDLPIHMTRWAIMDNYGTGSEMDRENPALDEYVGSDKWNPARAPIPGAPITGRPAGEYVAFTGEHRFTSGRNAGRNLEHLEGFAPMEPSLAYEKAGDYMEMRMADLVQRAMERVNPMNYLVDV
jgi:hypothetical protein